jgi:serine/threonine-protein kinase HipA
MRKLEVRLDWGDEQVVVGTLAEQEKVIYFEYDSAFIAKPLPISPFKLPIPSGVFEHREREFGNVFGVFNDSLPDGWGLLLMDREFRKRGHDPAGISILDRLAYIGTRGMGHLPITLRQPPLTRDISKSTSMNSRTRRSGCWKGAPKRFCRPCESRAVHPAGRGRKCWSGSAKTGT